MKITKHIMLLMVTLFSVALIASCGGNSPAPAASGGGGGGGSETDPTVGIISSGVTLDSVAVTSAEYSLSGDIDPLTVSANTAFLAIVGPAPSGNISVKGAIDVNDVASCDGATKLSTEAPTVSGPKLIFPVKFMPGIQIALCLLNLKLVSGEDVPNALVPFVTSGAAADLDSGCAALFTGSCDNSTVYSYEQLKLTDLGESGAQAICIYAAFDELSGCLSGVDIEAIMTRADIGGGGDTPAVVPPYVNGGWVDMNDVGLVDGHLTYGFSSMGPLDLDNVAVQPCGRVFIEFLVYENDTDCSVPGSEACIVFLAQGGQASFCTTSSWTCEGSTMSIFMTGDEFFDGIMANMPDFASGDILSSYYLSGMQGQDTNQFNLTINYFSNPLWNCGAL